jgi:hypothetical protein
VDGTVSGHGFSNAEPLVSSVVQFATYGLNNYD